MSWSQWIMFTGHVLATIVKFQRGLLIEWIRLTLKNPFALRWEIFSKTSMMEPPKCVWTKGPNCKYVTHDTPGPLPRTCFTLTTHLITVSSTTRLEHMAHRADTVIGHRLARMDATWCAVAEGMFVSNVNNRTTNQPTIYLLQVQHPESDNQGALQLQIPLVLLRRMQNMQ